MNKKLKIVADENMPLIPEVLESIADVYYYPGRQIDAQVISDADALLIRSVTRVYPEMLLKSPLSFIGTATIGTDHIHPDLSQQHDLKLASAPGCNAQSVAEYVLAGLLFYSDKKKVDLREFKVGIIGGGNTGSAVAEILSVLGVGYKVYDPLIKSQKHRGNFTDWKGILDADIVTLHVPLTEDCNYPTNQLINSKNIQDFNAKLLINACRGGVLTNEAIIRGKQEFNKDFILDVFENEPNCDLKTCQQCLLTTPHVAGYSKNGKIAGSIAVLKALSEHFSLALPNLPELEYYKLQGPQPTFQQLTKWWPDHIYDIKKDRQQFMQKFEQFPSGFDLLRKKYQHRKELGLDTIFDWFG